MTEVKVLDEMPEYKAMKQFVVVWKHDGRLWSNTVRCEGGDFYPVFDGEILEENFSDPKTWPSFLDGKITSLAFIVEE